MEGLPVFPYDVSPALAALGERAEGLKEEGPSAEAKLRLASWLLGEAPEPDRRNLGRRLGERLPGAEDPTPPELATLLRAARPDAALGAATPDAAALAARLAAPPEESWGTLEFLALCCLHQRRAPLPREAERRLRRLMGKFEVFGRVFDRYDADLRKGSDAYADLLVYALLSLALLGLYDRTRNLNVFNTALKLNDLLAGAGELLVEAPEVLAAFAALAGGRSRLEEWYASQGFRLPADR